jgi:O-antigen/teichoic acid export membrane protein
LEAPAVAETVAPPVSRSRRFLSGVAANYLSQAVVMAGGLYLTRFLLLQVGREEYGVWLVILQLLAYLELLDLGVLTLVPREVAYATGRADGPAARVAAVAEFLGKVTRLLRWQTPLVAVVAAGLWLCAGGQSGEMRAALGLVALFYVVTFPWRIYQPALLGLQDLAVVGWANTTAWVIQAVLTVLLVLTGLGLWSLVVSWTVSRLLLTAFCWFRLRTAFSDSLPRRRPPLPAAEGKRLLTRGLWLTVTRVAQVLLNGTDILILGWLLGPAAVVVYACTAKLTMVFSTQAYALIITAEPALSELRVSAAPERVMRASTALGQLMLLASGLIACVLLATNQGFVTWWLGPEQYGGTALTVLLLAAMLTRHLTFTFGHILYCFGYEKALALMGLADGAVTVGGTILLVALLGPCGAALGSLLGVCLVSLPVSLYLLARDAGMPLGAMLRCHVPWLWRFGLLAASLLAFTRVWLPVGAPALIAAGVGVCCLYGLVMWPVLSRSPLWVFLEPHLTALRARLAGLRAARAEQG